MHVVLRADHCSNIVLINRISNVYFPEIISGNKEVTVPVRRTLYCSHVQLQNRKHALFKQKLCGDKNGSRRRWCITFCLKNFQGTEHNCSTTPPMGTMTVYETTAWCFSVKISVSSTIILRRFFTYDFIQTVLRHRDSWWFAFDKFLNLSLQNY